MKKTTTASTPWVKDTGIKRVPKVQKYFPLKQSSQPIKKKYPRGFKEKPKKKTPQIYLYINRTYQESKDQRYATIVACELYPG